MRRGCGLSVRTKQKKEREKDEKGWKGCPKHIALSLMHHGLLLYIVTEYDEFLSLEMRRELGSGTVMKTKLKLPE